MVLNWLKKFFGFGKEAPPPPRKEIPAIHVKVPPELEDVPIIEATLRPTLETRLLEFIGNLEAPKGYNQRYGEKVPAMNLAEMAVIDILIMQEVQIENGARSTAVGRYQFINKTLRRLVEKLKIDPARRFDPILQDLLATELLRERGLEKFKRGEMSLETFANNLAREWASLPILTNINGKQVGQSYYAHDGLNRALTSPESVRKVLIA